MNNFNAKEIKDKLIKWIKLFFEENGKGCNAVIGISGGKDSTVVAGLCVEALGKDRVIGVLMPNGIQNDIQDAKNIVKFLGIRSYIINIENSFDCLTEEATNNNMILTNQAIINLPARLRMCTLYMVSQSNNGRVANTCNLSEDYVGYATRYGDASGDFSPLSELVVREVIDIGRELGLSERLLTKAPLDGLCGKTDEENLGFSYDVLDEYIRTGNCKDKKIKQKIDEMHNKNKFKLELMPKFEF